MHAVVRKFPHLGRGFAENPVQICSRNLIFHIVLIMRLGNFGIQTAGIKGGGIMGDSAGSAEGAGEGLFLQGINLQLNYYYVGLALLELPEQLLKL